MLSTLEKYTKGMQVIELIRQGKTLTMACRQTYITRHLIVQMARKDELFREALQDAEQEGQDCLAEMLVDIDIEESDPKMAKVKSDNIKWLLSKRRVADYGDRMIVETSSTQDKAIIGALGEAIKRIPMPEQPALPPEPNVIDVTPVEEEALVQDEAHHAER